MNIRTVLLIACFVPSAALAAYPCKGYPSALERNDCLAEMNAAAEQQMTKYLNAGRERYSDTPNVVRELNKAQTSWKRFRDDHCSAVYEMWVEGSISNEKYGYCKLDQTRRRIHDLWRQFLTYADSTPPVLPEPTWAESVY